MDNTYQEIQSLIEKIKSLSDKQATKLVGILCKRVEVLEEEEQEQQEKFNNPSLKVLTPSLYKKLLKEIIYEQNRNFKELLDILGIPVLKVRELKKGE